MKKVLVMGIVVLSMLLAVSCATPQSTSAEYTTNVNVDSSNLVLADRIEVSGKFSDSEVESGYATQVLSAKALSGTNYDFLFMQRIEKVGSTVTLSGRPARLK